MNVTNRKDEEYIELLKESNLIGLEVDVPADLVDSLDKLDHVLFVSSDNWRWLNRTGPFLDSNRIPPEGAPLSARAIASAPTNARTTTGTATIIIS